MKILPWRRELGDPADFCASRLPEAIITTYDPRRTDAYCAFPDASGGFSVNGPASLSWAPESARSYTRNLVETVLATMPSVPIILDRTAPLPLRAFPELTTILRDIDACLG